MKPRRIITLLFVFSLCVFISSVKKEVLYEAKGPYTIGDAIMTDNEEIDDYLRSIYGSSLISIETNHQYGLLSVRNYSQTGLKNYYNKRLDRFDLNRDGYITVFDTIGAYAGTCQPTASTMILDYYESTSLMPNKHESINDTFYDVVKCYLKCGWTHGGANVFMNLDALDYYFKISGYPYKATIKYDDLFNVLDGLYESNNTGIVNFNVGKDSHSSTFSGYVNKTVKYLKKDKIITEEYTYVCINDNWNNGHVNGELVMKYNYSYIDLSYLSSVIYIEF